MEKIRNVLNLGGSGVIESAVAIVGSVEQVSILRSVAKLRPLQDLPILGILVQSAI